MYTNSSYGNFKFYDAGRSVKGKDVTEVTSMAVGKPVSILT